MLKNATTYDIFLFFGAYCENFVFLFKSELYPFSSSWDLILVLHGCWCQFKVDSTCKLTKNHFVFPWLEQVREASCKHNFGFVKPLMWTDFVFSKMLTLPSAPDASISVPVWNNSSWPRAISLSVETEKKWFQMRNFHWTGPGTASV